MKQANKEMKAFSQASEAFTELAAMLLNAAIETRVKADRVSKNYSNVQEQLKKIRAKRELGMKLTEREAAMWTLYGEERK